MWNCNRWSRGKLSASKQYNAIDVPAHVAKNAPVENAGVVGATVRTHRILAK
jgi:hypothetical protein